MNSSGIKRGLAVSAVSALATAGLFTGTAHAAPVAPSGLNITHDVSSVSIDNTVTYTITAANGAKAGADVVDVTLSEQTPLGADGQRTDEAALPYTPFTVGSDTLGTVGTPVDDADQADKTYSRTFPVTLGADGTAKLKISSELAGSVKVQAKFGSTVSSALSSFTVGGGLAGNSNVGAINVPTTVNKYLSETASAVITTVDAKGFGVEDAAVAYTIDGKNQDSVDIDDASAPGDDDVNYRGSLDLSTLPVGTHTIKLWVNTQDGAGTDGADAGEKTATITVNVAADPEAALAAQDGITSSAVTKVGGVAELPANEPISVPVSIKLVKTVDGETVPAGGVSVRLDPMVGAVALDSISTITGENGVATVNVPVTKAQAVDAEDLTVSAYTVKGADATDAALKVAADVAVATFDARENSIAPAPGLDTTVSATEGGSVSLNVKVADQFGKSAAGKVLNVSFDAGSANAAQTADGVKQITTNASGVATFTYTDVAKNGDDSIVVTDSTNALITNTFTVEYVSSLTPTLIEMTAVAAADETVAADAKVDDYDVVVKNDDGVAIKGTSVTFSTNLGFVTDGEHKATAITLKTDATGHAKVQAGSTVVGQQVITVTAGSAPAVQFAKHTYAAGAFYGFQVSGPAQITVGQSAKYSVLATDAFGNAFTMGNESFNVEQSGAGALASGSSVDSYGIPASGRLSFTVEAGSAAGSGSLAITRTTGGAIADEDGATAAKYTKALTVNYTVKTVPVVAPPVANPTQPKPLTSIRARIKLQSKVRDIVTITAPAPRGTAVTVYRVVRGHLHRAAHGALVGGKRVFKIKDRNGHKKTTYVAIVSASSTTKADRSVKKSIK